MGEVEAAPVAAAPQQAPIAPAPVAAKKSKRYVKPRSVKELLFWYILAFVLGTVATYVFNIISSGNIEPLYGGGVCMVGLLALHYIDMVSANGP